VKSLVFKEDPRSPRRRVHAHRDQLARDQNHAPAAPKN